MQAVVAATSSVASAVSRHRRLSSTCVGPGSSQSLRFGAQQYLSQLQLDHDRSEQQPQSSTSLGAPSSSLSAYTKVYASHNLNLHQQTHRRPLSTKATNNDNSQSNYNNRNHTTTPIIPPAHVPVHVPSILSKEAATASIDYPTSQRFWALPPAIAIHVSIGSVYVYSMWTPGMSKTLGKI